MAPKKPTETQIKKAFSSYLSLKQKQRSQASRVDAAERIRQKAQNALDEKLKTWQKTTKSIENFEDMLRSEGMYSATMREWDEYVRKHPEFFDRSM